MLDKQTIYAPAKINLFLQVLNKRNDGYHNIRSGVTFVNLFDEINIKKSNKMLVKYSGAFKPNAGTYKNCIIKKTLKFIKINHKINLEINIKKNIPVKAGMGAASTNVASLLKCLHKMNIIKLNNNIQYYSSLGKDVPVCLFQKSSLIEGAGEIINKKRFPKYFFLIIKPKVSFSTKEMYDKISNNLFKDNKKNLPKNILYNYREYRNDFEKIAIEENREISKLLMFLSNTENSLFSRMTGSGSSCFAVFDKFENANKAQVLFKKKYKNLWSFVAQNNYTSSKSFI